MPPPGVGVNLAMLDARDLGLALAASATVEEALRAYEMVLLPRSADVARLHRGRRRFPARGRGARLSVTRTALDIKGG